MFKKVPKRRNYDEGYKEFERYQLYVPKIISPNKGSYARVLILDKIEIQRKFFFSYELNQCQDKVYLSVFIRKDAGLGTEIIHLGDIVYKTKNASDTDIDIEKAIKYPWTDPVSYQKVLERTHRLLLKKENLESLTSEIKKLKLFIAGR